MIFAPVLHVPAAVFNKLTYLYHSLHNVREHFEVLASQIKDKTSQRIIRGLAQESCQYANELASQIQSLGGCPEAFFNNHVPHATATTEATYTMFNLSEKVLQDCTCNETNLIKAYREVLNEFDLFPDTRNMLRSQLNGIMCSFLQMKLLLR